MEGSISLDNAQGFPDRIKKELGEIKSCFIASPWELNYPPAYHEQILALHINLGHL